MVAENLRDNLAESLGGPPRFPGADGHDVDEEPYDKGPDSCKSRRRSAPTFQRRSAEYEGESQLVFGQSRVDSHVSGGRGVGVFALGAEFSQGNSGSHWR